METRMTDNEIIKALKCCSETTGSECSECPLLNVECSAYDLYKLAFDLIHRQKEKIEMLQDFNENLQTGNTALSNEILEIKSEAIKEFADRLKEKKYKSCEWSHGEHPYIVEECDIDNLVKEMTE